MAQSHAMWTTSMLTWTSFKSPVPRPTSPTLTSFPSHVLMSSTPSNLRVVVGGRNHAPQLAEMRATAHPPPSYSRILAAPLGACPRTFWTRDNQVRAPSSQLLCTVAIRARPRTVSNPRQPSARMGSSWAEGVCERGCLGFAAYVVAGFSKGFRYVGIMPLLVRVVAGLS